MCLLEDPDGNTVSTLKAVQFENQSAYLNSKVGAELELFVRKDKVRKSTIPCRWRNRAGDLSWARMRVLRTIKYEGGVLKTLVRA